MIESNYYNTLKVSPNASAEEIKKAYRKLAMQYHPDVAGDNQAFTEQFRAIKTAYDVLGNSKTRQQYHYKHFYKDFKTQPVVTAEMIAEQAKELAAFSRVLDPYRINEEGLYDEIMALLTQYNLTILKQNNNAGLKKTIIVSLLYCAQLLTFNKTQTVSNALLSLAGDDVSLVGMIEDHTRLQKRLHYWNTYKLALAVIITIGLCVAMYLLV